MEVVLMTVYAPWIIEFMGSIDIPHEKLMVGIINAYGFISVFRGNATPSSMKAGVEVLKQNGFWASKTWPEQASGRSVLTSVEPLPIL